MTTIGIRRLQRELKQSLKSDQETNSLVRFEPKGDDIRELKAEITGPSDTPYEGGTFLLDISVPESYPIKPPVVKFVTKVWHPNISSMTGAICLDILSKNWAASITLRTVLLSLQALLESPVPDDPQDAVVAKQFLRMPGIFKRTASHWAKVYAGANSSNEDFEKKTNEVVAKGFTEDKALFALSVKNWDVAQALKFLED